MGDGVAFAIQKGDVQDTAYQYLLSERFGDSTTHVGSDQSGVNLVAQVGRDEEGSHCTFSRRAVKLHQLTGAEIRRGYDDHNQGGTDKGRRSGR